MPSTEPSDAPFWGAQILQLRLWRINATSYLHGIELSSKCQQCGTAKSSQFRRPDIITAHDLQTGTSPGTMEETRAGSSSVCVGSGL